MADERTGAAGDEAAADEQSPGKPARSGRAPRRKAPAEKAAAGKAAQTGKAAAKPARPRKPRPEDSVVDEHRSPDARAPAKRSPAKGSRPPGRRPTAEAVLARMSAPAPAPEAAQAGEQPVDDPGGVAPSLPPAPAAVPTEQAEKRPRAGMPDPDSIDRPWLDAYPPGVPASYDYPAVLLPRLLDDAARDFPDIPAVAFLGATRSYRRIADEADRFATALSRLGVGAGHVVGLALPNCPQHVVALFAVLRLGAVAVECGTDLPPEDLQRVVNDSGCGMLVIHDPVYRALGRLKGRLPTVRHVVGTALADALPATRRRLLAARRGDPDAAYSIPPGEGVQRYAKLVRGPRAVPPMKPADPRTTVAVLMPDAEGRLVELTHANLVAAAFQVRLWLPDVQAGREEVLGAAPLSTAEGLVLTLGFGVLSAATMNLLPQRGPDALASGVGRRVPTLLLSSAETFGSLGRLGGPGRALGGVRAALSVGAEPPAEATAVLERRMGAKVRVGFGCGPAAALVCANPVYGSAKPGTAGLPVPDTVVSLRHPADPLREAPPGEPGLLAVRGPQVATGHRNRAQDSRADLRDGWLITDVLATVDDEGYVTVMDGAPARQEG